MLTSFRKELEAKKQEFAKSKNVEHADSENLSPEESLTLSNVLHAIAEVGDTYVSEYCVSVIGLRRLTHFHIRLPPPAFFFMEHGTPFILHSLGLPARGVPQMQDSPKQIFDRQVRTCCVSIISPQLTIDFLSRLPRYFIQSLYMFIIDLIAPPELVGVIRAFLNKCEDPKDRLSLNEMYLMAGKSSRSAVEYLFPKIENPYLRDSLEHIIFEIGRERDMKDKQTELQAMAGGSMKRGFFG